MYIISSLIETSLVGLASSYLIKGQPANEKIKLKIENRYNICRCLLGLWFYH